MNHLRATLFLASLIIIGSPLSAIAEKGTCGTREPDLHEKLVHERNLKARLLGKDALPFAVHVPIYWHILQSERFPNQVSDETITEQLDILNASFADAGFTFSTASLARHFVANSQAAFEMGSAEEAAVKSAFRQGGAGDLNIYIIRNKRGDDTLGWATFPFEYEQAPLHDGVVMNIKTLPGGPAPYGLGDTLVHEVGHWAGLYHTFQDKCSATNDLVTDTPAHKVNYACEVSDTCFPKRPGALLAKPHLRGRDPIRNFMNYTPDRCMNKFSEGQNVRMIEAFGGYRVP